MRIFIKHLLLTLPLILVSCNSKETELPVKSGSAHLASLVTNGISSGFSFRVGAVVSPIESGGVDFLLITQLDEIGVPVGSSLSGPDMETNFAPLQADGVIVDSDLFESIIEIPDSVNQWEPTANIQSGEIWFVRTRQGNYGKLFFSEVIEVAESEELDVFSIASFKWVFQPNGTRNFD